MSEEKKLIKLIKDTSQGWPRFAHPDCPEHEVRLKGSFEVRWPDGTSSKEKLVARRVYEFNGKKSPAGTMHYFERDGILYEPCDVELEDEAVKACLVFAGDEEACA